MRAEEGLACYEYLRVRIGEPWLEKRERKLGRVEEEDGLKTQRQGSPSRSSRHVPLG